MKTIKHLWYRLFHRHVWADIKIHKVAVLDEHEDVHEYYVARRQRCCFCGAMRDVQDTNERRRVKYYGWFDYIASLPDYRRADV